MAAGRGDSLSHPGDPTLRTFVFLALFLLTLALIALTACESPPPTTTPDIEATVTSAIAATATAEADIQARIDASVAATVTAELGTPTATPAPTATPRPAAPPAPTATPKPTAVPTSEPVCLRNPRQVTSTQAQQIADLPWSQDNPWSVTALQQLARGSPAAFQAWMQRFRDDETHERLIKAFTSIAVCDEAAALRIAQMPFLDDAGVGAYFTASDGYILEGLARLASTNLDDLDEVLVHSDLEDGITDPLTAVALLLILKQEDPEAEAAIRDLPWIADGITNTGVRRNEINYVVGFVERARRANESFWAFLELPWMRDGYQWTEYGVAINLGNLAYWDDASTARILKMPFLETLEGDEEDIVYFLLDVAYRRGLLSLISSPRLEGGIRDGQLGTVALADIELRDPEAAAALNGLAWIQDGVGFSEQTAVRSLVNTAAGSDALFRALLAKRWVRDRLTHDESRVVERLHLMASSPSDKSNEAMALRILDMPFLNNVTALDYLAVNALNTLLFSGDEGALEQVLSHRELRDGITDEWTSLVAVTNSARENPSLRNALLDPQPPPVQKRVIRLPLAGDVTLHAIEPEDGSASQAQMNILEHAVRTHEGFMGQPFPHRDVVLFISDDSLQGYFGDGLIESGSRSRAATITELAASTWGFTPIWLVRPSAWIGAGARHFLTQISERERIDRALPEARDSCEGANSITELFELGLENSPCKFDLGEGMFLDLYRNLGEADFRKGFSNLHWVGREPGASEGLRRDCTGEDAVLCYLKGAFLSPLSPALAATAEWIIDRRYYGTSG